MSIQTVTEKEQQLTHMLKMTTDALKEMREERDVATNTALERAAVVCEGKHWTHESGNAFGKAIRALKEVK